MVPACFGPVNRGKAEVVSDQPNVSWGQFGWTSDYKRLQAFARVWGQIELSSGRWALKRAGMGVERRIEGRGDGLGGEWRWLWGDWACAAGESGAIGRSFGGRRVGETGRCPGGQWRRVIFYFIVTTPAALWGRMRVGPLVVSPAMSRGSVELRPKPARTICRLCRAVPPPPPLFSALPGTHPVRDVFRCRLQGGSLRQCCLRVGPS